MSTETQYQIEEFGKLSHRWHKSGPAIGDRTAAESEFEKSLRHPANTDGIFRLLEIRTTSNEIARASGQKLGND